MKQETKNLSTESIKQSVVNQALADRLGAQLKAKVDARSQRRNEKIDVAFNGLKNGVFTISAKGVKGGIVVNPENLGLQFAQAIFCDSFENRDRIAKDEALKATRRLIKELA